MPTDITMTPEGKPGKSSETKSKDSKSGNQKKTQIIMDFLREWKRRVRLTPSGTRDLTPRAK